MTTFLEVPLNGSSRSASEGATPHTSTAGREQLSDGALAFAADVLDDVERVKIANANRLRILTRTEPDEDGEMRGFGLDESHPDVARLATIVDTLEKVYVDATKNLEKIMRRHPLYAWVRVQTGLGDKQVGRLLAAIGDPYWNTLHHRPRTVSELWAYCGFHVKDGQAPRRTRGQKANWSDTARKRAWLIANSVVKSGGPYREVYDRTKIKYVDAVHKVPCVRCGPSGSPAAEGSPLSKAHIHARALRAIAKAVLRDLWIEAKRVHEGQ